MKEEEPKVLISFEPTKNFEDELLEFIEEVLSWQKI